MYCIFSTTLHAGNQASTAADTSNMNGTSTSIELTTTTTNVNNTKHKRYKHSPSTKQENSASTSLDDEKKDDEDRSSYGLMQIFMDIISEMEKGNFNFPFIWIIMFGINLFVYIYGGMNIKSYYCPSECIPDTSIYFDYDCECEDVSDDSYYYSDLQCGETSDGTAVYCQEQYDRTWEILISITPCIDWFLLFVYFLIYYRIHICKAFFFAIFFIPMTILMFAPTVAMIGITSFLAPIFVWNIILNDLQKKKTDENTVAIEKEKKNYTEMENNMSHFHLIVAIVHNKDWRFLVLWVIMFGGTLYMVIINAIGLAENTYKCECTVCDDYYYCEESFDVGNDCGTDEYGADVQCEAGNESELRGYRLAIGLTFLADYLIIVFLWICVCRVSVSKACVLAFPVCIMMLGASVPFTILGAIFALFAMFICY